MVRYIVSSDRRVDQRIEWGSNGEGKSASAASKDIMYNGEEGRGWIKTQVTLMTRKIEGKMAQR